MAKVTSMSREHVLATSTRTPSTPSTRPGAIIHGRSSAPSRRDGPLGLGDATHPPPAVPERCAAAPAGAYGISVVFFGLAGTALGLLCARFAFKFASQLAQRGSSAITLTIRLQRRVDFETGRASPQKRGEAVTRGGGTEDTGRRGSQEGTKSRQRAQSRGPSRSTRPLVSIAKPRVIP
ncbi:hypothetical protein PUNSTDRAFT_115783 [Punctularia strigosozonata HHB-11173 SS5]|uniref:uncharacterized protein n=1 Tax=Punctularia strigosozonata (strain HHB-11173) TaxID=741275 RepID=UPI000441836B|nr:uncharacterized protein PUNSTDRAFT_115783 [Punctularia strigosozonata HHB-11173 SS5]EIN05887.1 hypothetical protein PUNSTDRAFT_115783 [Punctularia strigosozonata HHB-11173 SS5]